MLKKLLIKWLKERALRIPFETKLKIARKFNVDVSLVVEIENAILEWLLGDELRDR